MTLFLNTKGTKGDISQELRQLLHYMEHTIPENAVNETLQDMQRMVEKVKQDGDVSLEFMKALEYDENLVNIGREEGKAEERINTERERVNAERERKRADAAELELAKLKEELAQLKSGVKK